VLSSRRLILAHFWLAFAAFGAALLLGEWQMFIRSPLHAWIGDPELYYRSVTAHGTAMAYVLPTLVAMGFGYFITEAALKRPLVGRRWAWAGFGLVAVGTVTAVIPVSMGLASVLYTFYPPMIGNPFYYIGIVLVVVGSWIWVALMSVNLHLWKRDNPGVPVPLAMFANVAGSYLWAWTAVGAAIEILFQILPVALGLTATIDAGLARVFFSWTLHAIVYFWLMPTYIAYYTIIPRAIGGRLYSDPMGRLAFVLFLVVAMPIGVHHLFADPQVGAGFKFLHSVFTALVALPTLLTVFTICASVEIAARLRGGRGAFGWIKALPWRNPMMLAVTFSFVMLGFGGAGGLINMSYQLDATIHNTQWITGHFHLIFGGAIVIMYFAIAYDIWPHLTGRALDSMGLMRAQLWTWFVGMIVLTFPWPLRRHPRHAAPHGVLRLHRSGHRAPGGFGGHVGVRRGDPRRLRRPVPDRAAPRPACAADRARRLPVQRGGAPAADRAHGAQRLRPVAHPHGRAHRRELRLPDRPAADDARERSAGGDDRKPAMSSRRWFPLRDPWVATSLAVTLVIAVGAAFTGFVGLPLLQTGPRFQGVWDAICSAAGLVRGAPAAEPVVQSGYQTTRVVVTPGMLDGASAEAVGRGRDLRAPLHRVPRRARPERRGFAQPRRPVCLGRLQAVAGLHVRRAHQRGDDAPGRRPGRQGHARPRCLLRLFAAAAGKPLGPRRASPADRRQRCAAARHRPLRHVPWRAGPQDGKRVAGRPTFRLSPGAAAELRVRRAAQRHQRTNAQHRPPDDPGGDRRRRPFLRERAVKHPPFAYGVRISAERLSLGF